MNGDLAPVGYIVPFYNASQALWDQLAAAARAHPNVKITAVFNPDSGPGAAADSFYTANIPKLRAAGVRVLAYVASTYGAKSLAAVQAEIDRYLSWYPSIDGGFTDEFQGSSGKEAYYSAIKSYWATHGKGYTVGNPGALPAESYVGTHDALVVYESAGTPGALSGWPLKYSRSNFALLAYGVPTDQPAWVKSAAVSAGNLYATNDVLDNPWDSLPPYILQTLAELEAFNASLVPVPAPPPVVVPPPPPPPPVVVTPPPPPPPPPPVVTPPPPPGPTTTTLALAAGAKVSLDYSGGVLVGLTVTQ